MKEISAAGLADRVRDKEIRAGKRPGRSHRPIKGDLGGNIQYSQCCQYPDDRGTANRYGTPLRLEP